MGEGVNEQFIKQVVASTVGSCGNCGQRYDESSISVVGHQDDLWFLSLTCSNCRSQSLVAALVKESFQIAATDLLPDEAERFRDAPAVGADDVLDIHQFLSEFDGDFRALFG